LEITLFGGGDFKFAIDFVADFFNVLVFEDFSQFILSSPLFKFFLFDQFIN